MQGLNLVQLIGNLGSDPEMRYTPSGKAVVNMRLAVNTGYGDNQRTDWFTLVAWDKLAEACAQYVVKGSRIYVEGRLQIRQWEGEDGQTRYATEVVARQIIFLDRPNGKPQNGAGVPDEGIPEGAEDIPF
ncbi:MAG: single-stranded DNA-binding protein [Caldilineae bacterium]|nr:MAG: single-stranded DNA-binding protein [Caldilineae bacterium]